MKLSWVKRLALFLTWALFGVAGGVLALLAGGSWNGLGGRELDLSSVAVGGAFMGLVWASSALPNLVKGLRAETSKKETLAKLDGMFADLLKNGMMDEGEGGE